MGLPEDSSSSLEATRHDTCSFPAPDLPCHLLWLEKRLSATPPRHFATIGQRKGLGRAAFRSDRAEQGSSSPPERSTLPREHAAERSPLPLPIPTQIPIAPQSRLKRLCSRGQTLDDPRELTEETTAQIGLYTHRALDGQGSSLRPGA